MMLILFFLRVSTNDFTWTSSLEIEDQKHSSNTVEMKYVNSTEILDFSVLKTKFYWTLFNVLKHTWFKWQ